MNHKIKICCFLLFIFAWLSFQPTRESVNPTENLSKWEITLHFTESNGFHDSITFGEANNAMDKESPDSYDMPKPPPPIPSYVYAWFQTDFEEPYNKIMTDYRVYNDTRKSWNISVIWVPEDYSSSSNITISWDKDNLSLSEYDKIQLFILNNSTTSIDMYTYDHFTFNIQANIPKKLNILCEQSLESNNPMPGFQMIFLFIASILVTIAIKIYGK